VGLPRAPQAQASLERLTSAGASVRGHNARITLSEAARWMREADLAIGSAPTYEERLILNDAAVAAGKPYVDAAMYDDEAQILCVSPGGPCLRCLIPEPPSWRADFPVIAAVSAAIGNLAAYHCLRILAGAQPIPWGELIHLDVERMVMKKTRLMPRPGCPTCSRKKVST
jgi:adenylyltransferase/sulfurtransferase